MHPKRHPQFILAIDNTYFEPVQRYGCTSDIFRDGLNPFPAELFLAGAQSYLVIRERDWLDNQVKDKWQQRSTGQAFKGDPTYRQFLPYCVIRIALPTGEWQYFLYKREPTVGEARLVGKVSAGYGGHIDLVDVVFDKKSVIDLAATIHFSSRREIFREETVIYDAENNVVDPATLQVNFTNQFITQETEVESLHVGIVMSLDLPVGYRVETPENELTSMEPMTARELLASGLPIEHWTRAIMEEEVRMMDKPTADMFSSDPEVAFERYVNSTNTDFAEQVVNTNIELIKNILDVSDKTARIRVIEKSAQVSFDLIKKVRDGGEDASCVEVDGVMKLRPYIGMINRTTPRAFHGGTDRPQAESVKEYITIEDDNGNEITLTDEESNIYKQLLSDKLKAAGLTVIGDLGSFTGGKFVAITDDFIPLSWEDVKDLSLTLGGEDANIAAFNEMTTGDPATPPSPEQVAAYQDKLGEQLEANVDTLMTGLVEEPGIDSSKV